MKIQNTLLAVAVGACCALGAVSSQAITVSAALPANTNLISDNSAEQLIDRNGSPAGILDVGDSLRGIVGFNTYEAGGQTFGIGNGTGVDELTGLFQVIVTSKTPLGNGRYDFTFAPDPLFEAIYGAGAVAALFDDPARDFARQSCGGANTFADCEATATNGTLWATVGGAPGSQFFWSATNALDNTTLGATLPLTTPLGTFSNGVNILTNNTGRTFGLVPCFDPATLTVHAVNLCGQGGVLASGRIASQTPTPYDIFDNVDYTIRLIPEPGSLALLALGLIAVGATTLRRTKN